MESEASISNQGRDFMSIDEDDVALFRSAVGPVEKKVRPERDHSRPKAPPPKPKQRALDEQAVMHELAHGHFDFNAVETGEEISYLSEGLNQRVLKRLRRGHWRVEESLDLHEMTVKVATNALREFLAEAQRAGLTCVKIIHGKGLRSGPDGPKLKRMSAGVLARHSGVLAFASAPHHDGGTGAVYVLLRTRT